MKRYKCLTRNSSLALAIFVPYYAGLDFRRNIRRRNVAERDAAWKELFKWLKKQPQWKESHILSFLNIERSPTYPTYFHPTSAVEILKWQDKIKLATRPVLFSFAGAQRPSRSRNGLVRTQVILQCKSSFKNCRFLDCDVKANSCDDPISLMKLFESSV
ncbi:PREDICTED: xyloglucan galactosyltransferase KATAMARI1 homolog [Brassica oleracea var. oleracea]|uniref:Exostosin GT47 domain-containing protein n=1 Tax=Brassica oleracea var. oleracea TaxID=109376 RepID=A0A0D3C3K0_BRAOL|nr:PREDICTED: xyloglucan galactosyltransferase KATAMARI1 homolog [Brassica oleracea var. oleracea]